MAERTIIEFARKSIPNTSNNSGKNSVLWWNKEYKKTIKEKTPSMYTKNMTYAKLIEFEQTTAIARKVVKQAKRNSWINYISSLIKHTPCDAMSNKLKKINNQNTNLQNTAIKNSQQKKQLKKF